MTTADTIAKRSIFVFLFLTLLLAIDALAQTSPEPATPAPLAAYSGWKIAKTDWGPDDEINYEKYISMIGEGVARGACSTVANCFRNPNVNPYASSDPAGLTFFSDCADLPYLLRAYFAWRNQLPFGFVSGLRPIPGSSPDASQDIRYSQMGNVVTSRYSVLARGGQLPNAISILNTIMPGYVSSASYRVSYSGMDADGVFSDFYPVKINRDAVRPGTIVYDPNGHVVTIYKITKDGRAYYIDAHPDNSITFGLFDGRFERSYPGQGAGFKNWRPLHLVGATYGGNNGYIGGRIYGAKDTDLPMYSTEQYYGTTRNPDWHQAQFNFQGRDLDFYEWVRNRLADGPLIPNPIDDVKIMTDELCNGVKDRIGAVQVAIASGIQNQAHPDRLPNNIFGAGGDWETYATPARDARLKVEFKQLRDYVEASFHHFRNRDGAIDYHGNNVSADMLKVYKQEAAACHINYTNSAGRVVSLNLEQVRARIYALSFDPYNCVELRWGAQGSELNTCQDDTTKRAWYDHEKWLRFQHDRNTDAFTGYTLDQLDGPKPGAGVASGQDLDIIAFLSKNQ